MNQDLKEEIAGYFLSDSNEYLMRYKILKKNQTHLGNRSKLLIDLVFSFECSLKALIFLNSKSDEKATIKKIKDASHNLKRLIKIADDDLILSIVSVIDKNFEYFSISSRYTLDAQIYFRSKEGVLSDKYYSTIADFNWLEGIFEAAQKLHNYVNSKIEYFKIVNFSEIEIEKTIENSMRISEINKKQIITLNLKNKLES